MEPDDLLCSRNAHDRNVLARDKSVFRHAQGWAGENSSSGLRLASEGADQLDYPILKWRKLLGSYPRSTCYAVLPSLPYF